MIFIELTEALSSHERLIARYGGMSGLRDEGALQSALIMPQNRLWYEGTEDIAILGATYAYHLTKAHAFFDGNKRIAAVISFAFVYTNRGFIDATEDEVVDLFMGIAASHLTREDVEAFFSNHIIYTTS